MPAPGGDEFDAYARLLERYDNLWLDTTMMGADYFALEVPLERFLARPDRILYGTDFPNLPYAWDRELTHLAHRKLDDAVLGALLGGNAERFFGLRI